ncbi:MAG: hydrogenase maturation protease [Phycisphaerae bacterium]|nr:hydrogenase maturation protease [Phycisphaerae bacterium]
MPDGSRRILVIGYGNPGRLDDGLGPALAAALEEAALPGVTVDADYQLVVDDAADVAKHDVVVFADAAVSGAEPFGFLRIEPKPALSFSSHSIEPDNVLALAESLFGARVEGYALAIRGYEFDEFGQRLSERARENLRAAHSFIVDVIERGSFAEAAAEHNRPSLAT